MSAVTRCGIRRHGLSCTCLLLCLTGVALRQELHAQDNAEDGKLIVSLAVQGETVLASTPSGLFRANRDKKAWQRLQDKTTPAPGGIFVSRGPKDKVLFYLITRAGWHESARRLWPWAGAEDKQKTKLERPGLYRSEDAGVTWELVDATHDFREMTRLPWGGRLFAIASAGAEERDRILLSEDKGRTWKDVTGGISNDERLLFLQRDPEHSDRVWLYAPFTMRRGGTIYHAPDEPFRWKVRYAGLDAGGWPPDALKTPAEFFAPYHAPGYRVQGPGSFSTVGILHARLDNYFAYPFGLSVNIPLFDIVPEKPAYEFSLKQPIAVRVSLVSYTEHTSPRLLDSPDASLFWALKVIGPDGKNKAYPLPDDSLGHVKNADRTLEQSSKEHKLEVFQLTPASPHARTIDLRAVGIFDQPGRYQVQLVFHSGWWRDSQKVLRSLDTVSGQVFDVTIEQ
jgi:hypothetical protein